MPDVWRPVAGGRPLSLAELPQAARELIAAAGNRKIWAFYGDMGGGKTTLIKTVCSLLGVSDGMSSPTFSIVNEYVANTGKVFHFDFYRIKNDIEAMDIGVEEYFDSGAYCFVEWPEKVETLMPDELFKVRLIPHGEGTRKIEFAR